MKITKIGAAGLKLIQDSEGWSSNRKWVYAGRFESVGRVRA